MHFQRFFPHKRRGCRFAWRNRAYIKSLKPAADFDQHGKRIKRQETVEASLSVSDL
jgi:hypothetical protein